MHVVEIGIYSGGSLEMWCRYFGERCHVYGIDIHPACEAFGTESVRIFIGNQADPEFWKRFLEQVPRVDVVIDDGGHHVHQQAATLEALLPRMSAGGVYLCEDLHLPDNRFQAYVDGLSCLLHTTEPNPSPLQQHVGSVHRYPYLVVIEKPDLPVSPLVAPRKGTVWQPDEFWRRQEELAARRFTPRGNP